MPKEKALAGLLGELAEEIVEEYKRNPLFARRLNAVLKVVPVSGEKRPPRSGPRSTSLSVPIPDIYREFESRPEAEFRLWAQQLPVQVLREIVRAHDFDAARRTSKWTDPEKLANFLSDQLAARVNRGSAFLRNESSSKKIVSDRSSLHAPGRTSEEPIVIGSVVVLASGGPRMTVMNVNGANAICSWLDGDGHLQRGSFPIEGLRQE
jgi:uncharacterized protein YodC (DUF2158 family)